MDVAKQKVDEHGRTLEVLSKGYEYVHQEKDKDSLLSWTHSPAVPGTPFGSGNYSAQFKQMQNLLSPEQKLNAPASSYVTVIGPGGVNIAVPTNNQNKSESKNSSSN